MSETITQEASQKRFGTFAGVFRPTILTILGALLYLREGWVVGHAGLGGFILILVGMYLVTGTTALSMASITTNIRLGQGGVFSIISQSLGLEAGGAIGLPFYLAQSLGGAMYIFAFAEGWAMIFPHHPQALVAIVVFVLVLVLALVSASLALKTQSVVVLGIIAALLSALWGLKDPTTLHEPAFWGPTTSPDLTDLFALFFPAATGVLVGASMSGSLKNPRRSVPVGTLAAVGVSFVVYLLMGVWFSVVASPQELRDSYTVMVDKAAIGQLVLVGLLASTLSASISSFVAAPRVLHALADYSVLPASTFLKTTHKGEPRRALLVTAAIVALGLLSGSLDAIAPMLTIFFLITYASINLVLLVEQSLGLPSFRPTFKVPIAVPLFGSAVCLLAITATSPVVGLISLVVVGALYVWLVSRRLDAPFETARSGLFVNIAAWAAKKIADLPASTERSWKPDLLMPVTEVTEVVGSYRLLKAMAGPKGSIKLVGLQTEGSGLSAEALAATAQDFKLDGIYCASTCLPSPSFGEGTVFSLSVLKGDFFPPNVAFVSVPDKDEAQLQKVLDASIEHHTGLALFVPHPRAGLGRERDLNLWVRDPGPDWKLKLKMGSLDLALLLALQLTEGWQGRLRLLCVVEDEARIEGARAFLDELAVEARIFGLCGMEVFAGDFVSQLQAAPQADLNIFGLGDHLDTTRMIDTTMLAQASCLFVRASGKESALA